MKHPHSREDPTFTRKTFLAENRKSDFFFHRLKFSMTQEKLADLTNCSREYIAYLENGVKTPSLPILVDLANALHISVDALLVDSLDYSLSSSDSDLHRLLLDCNETEQEIIIRTARELKATLVSFGI